MNLIAEYIKFYLTARTPTRMHSPYLFDLLPKIFDESKSFYAFSDIESRRLRLNSDDTIIQVPELGAGSHKKTAKRRTIGEFSTVALSSDRQCEVLFRLVAALRPHLTIELGAALGISTAYLASAHKSGQVMSFEGNAQFLEIAKGVIHGLKLENVSFVEGNFDNTLEANLNSLSHKVDLAFIDGNHLLEPTIRYYELIKSKASADCVFIIDDIRWSDEMFEAWKRILDDPDIGATVDAFSFGLIFLSPIFKRRVDFKVTPPRLHGGPIVG